jgi:hypothetical protein
LTERGRSRGRACDSPLYAKEHRNARPDVKKHAPGLKCCDFSMANQPPSFEVDHRAAWDLRRRTEIIPVKEPHTRIKPLALASGHGRYITVIPERTHIAVISLHRAIINLYDNRFTSDTVS